MAEPIEMPFGLWTRVGKKKHVLDGVQIIPCKWTILRGKERPIVKDRDSAVSCTKMAEPIEMLFGTWTQAGSRKQVLDGDAHWRHTVNTTEPLTCRGDAAFSSNYWSK